MTEVTFTHEITVRLVKKMGNDEMIVAAAKVSTEGEEALAHVAPDTDEHKYNAGLINYLMKHRHGTPFEHSTLTFFVHAPIFVWREWHRHRIGFSYNEESGRYKQLEPVFYIPSHDRPMFKTEGWKPARPVFTPISTPEEEAKYKALCGNLCHSYRCAYDAYTDNLQMDIDPGLARACLPVGIYSSCWVTTNPRALLHFLSLRTHEDTATFISYPLHEIEVAAKVCEEFLRTGWPLLHAAFIKNGRVAP